MAGEPVFEDGHPIDSDGPFIVVGANGFLGSEICLHLRKRNRWAKIVAPLRLSSVINPRLDAVDMIWVRCPMVDRQAMEACLEKANEGAGLQRNIAGIFYAAGLTTFSTSREDLDAMEDANVRLPNMVLQFCTELRLRTVYCSCSHVVGCQFIDNGDWISHDDTDRCEATIQSFPFLQQRRDVELHWHQEALKGRAPIIFLRPSLLLGPGDERVRSTYCLLELITGLGPIAVKYGGGIAFVDVRDVASACMQCMFGAVSGGTLMNLNAANLPFGDFVDLVEQTLRISSTSWIPYNSTPRIPAPVLRGVARLAEKCRDLLNMPFDERYSPLYVESKLRFYNVSCQRAKAVIHWDPRDLEDTVQDTAKYLARLLRTSEAERDDIRVAHKQGRPQNRAVRVVGLNGAKAAAAASWRRPRASTTRQGSYPRRMLLMLILAFLVVAAICVAFG